jgi:uncharacterized membrane protein YccC
MRTIAKVHRLSPSQRAAGDSRGAFQYSGLDNFMMKPSAEVLGSEGMRIRSLVLARLEEREREQKANTAANELEALQPQWQAARTQIAKLRTALLNRREEALRDLCRLEDRLQELKAQLADGLSMGKTMGYQVVHACVTTTRSYSPTPIDTLCRCP